MAEKEKEKKVKPSGPKKVRKKVKKNVAHGQAHIKSTKAMEHGLKKVDVFVKGPGSGRETAIRSLQASGLEVGQIQDVTSVPFNGVRSRKRRRV